MTLCLGTPALAQDTTVTYRTYDGRVLEAPRPSPAPVTTLRQVRQQLDDATLALIALRRADQAAAAASPAVQQLAALIVNLEQQVQIFEKACGRATPGHFPVCD
jgi:hypothetical protein